MLYVWHLELDKVLVSSMPHRALVNRHFKGTCIGSMCLSRSSITVGKLVLFGQWTVQIGQGGVGWAG